ncbi:hypothetical protein TWF730_010677 [Orbilia blumenaviensis]|uniref:Geranylgeranyl diphosphate synthase n=1 Tax=Orbilia blumenaviensis TaxID=1796055 RepID=A0AAV9UPD5_9PEZI
MEAPNHLLDKLPILSDEVVREPCDYIRALPSKKTLDILIDGLNVWYNVPSPQVDAIKSICETIHRTSLVIDDIQDGSDLRRGKPAAHMVFGTPQSINSATYHVVKSFEEACKLSFSAVQIVIEGLGNIQIGQGHDLHWTFHGEVPSEEDYIRMIDGKTGGFFPIAARLMRDQATRNKELDVEDFLLILGRFYQIRDDYMNLASQDYNKAKGHLSDLDEGKYSMILIHALKNTTEGTKLKSLLALRSRQGGLSPGQKDTILQILEKTGSMKYVLNAMKELQKEMKSRLGSIEDKVGEKNYILQAIMAKLQVEDSDK